MTAVATLVLPAAPARRAASRASRWWSKAWIRAVEEAAYGEPDLAAGRALSRSGRIGRISVEPGRFVAAVEDPRGLWAVVGALPVLDPQAVEALVEAVAAEPGRMAALLAGDLPFDLVEHAEEAGVELLPYGGELGASCTCAAWTDPCPHALAVMYQLAWLLEADPCVLLHLRGLPREELLARLPAAAGPPGVDVVDAADDVDLDVAEEAAARARRLLWEWSSQAQDHAPNHAQDHAQDHAGGQ